MFPCGHPDEAARRTDDPGNPVACGWCWDLRSTENLVRQREEAKAARVVMLFAEVAHEHPLIDWGTDGAGIHLYQPGEPGGCPVCEALDVVLVQAETAGDLTALTPDERDRLRAFRDAGLMWLVNTAVLHPRGFALAVELAENGEPLGLTVVGDGTEPWAYDDDTVQESFLAHYDTEFRREQEWTLRLKGDHMTIEGRAEPDG